MADEQSWSGQVPRRAMLRRVGLGTALVWTAPVLQTVRVAAFAASHRPQPKPKGCGRAFSDPSVTYKKATLRFDVDGRSQSGSVDWTRGQSGYRASVYCVKVSGSQAVFAAHVIGGTEKNTGTDVLFKAEAGGSSAAATPSIWHESIPVGKGCADAPSTEAIKVETGNIVVDTSGCS